MRCPPWPLRAAEGCLTFYPHRMHAVPVASSSHHSAWRLSTWMSIGHSQRAPLLSPHTQTVPVVASKATRVWGPSRVIKSSSGPGFVQGLGDKQV